MTLVLSFLLGKAPARQPLMSGVNTYYHAKLLNEVSMSPRSALFNYILNSHGLLSQPFPELVGLVYLPLSCMETSTCVAVCLAYTFPAGLAQVLCVVV